MSPGPKRYRSAFAPVPEHAEHTVNPGSTFASSRTLLALFCLLLLAVLAATLPAALHGAPLSSSWSDTRLAAASGSPAPAHPLLAATAEEPPDEASVPRSVASGRIGPSASLVGRLSAVQSTSAAVRLRHKVPAYILFSALLI
jgi:hypothetical protein